MKRHNLGLALALCGVGCLLAADSGAAEVSQLTGSRLPNGLAVSFVPANKADIESPQLRIYIDSDGDPATGFKVGGIGADCMLSAGKFCCYVGDEDGKAKWEPVDVEIANVVRKGRYIVFFSNDDLDLSGKTTVGVVVCDGGRELGKISVPWKTVGKTPARFQRSGKAWIFSDPAGDTAPGARIDFIAATVKPNPKKPNTLMFCYTNDFPIDSAKLSYNMRVMLRIGDAPGYGAEKFNYMIESRKLYSFAGSKPLEWKWKFLGSAPTRFTKQWSEIDLPLELLPERPKKIAFRLTTTDGDMVPDQNYPAPEYPVPDSAD